MAEHTVQIQWKEKTVRYPEGTCYGEILQELDPELAKDTALVLYNGKLRELHKPALSDGKMQAVSLQTEIGRDTYRRSLNFLFLTAVRELADESSRVKLHFANANGYYYSISGMDQISDAFAEEVRTRMQEMVALQIPIKKEKLKTQEAAELFSEQGMEDKMRLFRFRRGSQVNLYSLRGYWDYFYGFMVWHTGYLQQFDVKTYAEGLVLVLPDLSAASETKREAATSNMLQSFTPYPKIFAVQMLSEDWEKRQGISTVADLNQAIIDDQINRQLLVTEALQESRVAEIAKEIRARGNIKFVMIAGPSSSGKTTFSRRLSIQLSAQGMVPHPLSLDDFYRDRAECPRDADGNLDFECLEALDVDLILQTFADLQQGKEVSLPHFNFLTGMPEYKGDTMQLSEEDIMVVEGIHGLNPKLAESLPEESLFRIYISALTTLNVDDHNYISTTDARLLRRIVRDYAYRGTAACETIERWPSVRAGEKKYIFPNQENADEMFNSALLYELSVLKVYAEPLLFQVPQDKQAYLEANRLLKFLDYFLGVPSESVPNNSILREFIGGSCFDV